MGKKEVQSLHSTRRILYSPVLYFSFNIFRKHKFAALTVKWNSHSCLELRLYVVFNEFHWSFSDFGLQGALVSGQKDAAMGEPWQVSVSLISILLLWWTSSCDILESCLILQVFVPWPLYRTLCELSSGSRGGINTSIYVLGWEGVEFTANLKLLPWNSPLGAD